MKKILIFGMTPIIGGIETYIITILQNIDTDKFEIDLLVNNTMSKLNNQKIKGFYRKMYEIPKFIKNPIKVLLYLKKICLENKYDVIYLNVCNASSSIYALMFRIFSKDTKIIFHSHNGNDSKKIRHFLCRPLLNKLADKKIACSEVAAKWMFGSKAVKNNEVQLFNNFIDTDKFLFNETYRKKIRKELNIENKFVIGHVGRFSPQKNHKELIDIFNKVLSDYDNVVLMLIGTGELEDEMKSYVKKLNIENSVLFLGLKDNTNEYYQAMDLFILPSLFEGLPIVGIEAQASGLKCLFADTIDKNSDISDNVEFVPLNNIDLWKENIEKIIKSNYRRENMKNVIINSGYDLENGIKKIENLYLGD